MLYLRAGAAVHGLGITSLGRSAQFEYINMDEAVRWAMATEELDGG